jgi:putative hemolysin
MINSLPPIRSRPSLSTSTLLDAKLQPFAPIADWVTGAGELSRLWEQAINKDDHEHLFDRLLSTLRITVKCCTSDLERVPREGPLVVVANHPHGLLDGLVIASVIRRARKDFRFLANSMLAGIAGLEPYVISVDVFGNSGAINRAAAREGIRWLRSGGALITFPAGEVSSFVGIPPLVADREWSEGPLRIARATGSKIVQSFISGGNSLIFHFAGFAHPGFRTLLLGRELLNKRGRDVRVAFGSPMSPSIAERPHANEYLRRRTWVMGQTRGTPNCSTQRSQVPIAAAVDPVALERNVAQLSEDRILFRSGVWTVLLTPAKELPNVLEEIGRLRELTFRNVGEGTGRRSDLDKFDEHYQHLVLWKSDTREIVGAYRLADVEDIVQRCGVRGLYTRTLFRYGRDFVERLTPGIELGRSFVRPEYQRRPQPLFYLWRGIGAVLARHQRFRYLFGPVSISNDYSAAARDLVARYFRIHSRAVDWSVRPRRPLRPTHTNQVTDVLPWLTDTDELAQMLADLEPDGKGLPVLLRHYLGIGAEVVDFNVDPAFSDALDALIVVDLTRCVRRALARYTGSEAALEYLNTLPETGQRLPRDSVRDAKSIGSGYRGTAKYPNGTS